MFCPTLCPNSFRTASVTSFAFAPGIFLSTMRMARLLFFRGSVRSTFPFAIESLPDDGWIDFLGNPAALRDTEGGIVAATARERDAWAVNHRALNMELPMENRV